MGHGMPQVVVKKVVGVLFLEAAKITLDHLAEHRMRESAGEGSGSGLARYYGEIRHLRDFLTRSVAGAAEQVTLELSAYDTALLVAALRRHHEVLDDKLVADVLMTPDEKLLAQRKRHLLGDWAYELATMPILELPLPTINVVSTGAVRALRTRISGKSYQRPVGDAVASTPGGSTAPEGDANQLRPPSRIISGSMLAAEGGRRSAVSAGIPSIPGLWEEGAAVPDATPLGLFHPRTMRDPRLRALAQLDLASLERALQVNDHRVALVMLASILEAITIDHANGVRQQLALSGGPESWNLAKLLEICMGDAFEAASRQTLQLLVNAPNLLRPAMQMTSPIVVTAALMQQALEFTRLVARTLGFASDSSRDQPGPDAAPAC